TTNEAASMAAQECLSRSLERWAFQATNEREPEASRAVRRCSLERRAFQMTNEAANLAAQECLSRSLERRAFH
ncbi:MAG TPA: hypothetical protein VK871_01885, partial [Candidatus Limnocylindrales bacterium]|nr:hypothetical protein [Candidatus Limnocylindrales bacterium]